MKKQNIYSYLQRSLLKVSIKSIHRNKYPILLDRSIEKLNLKKNIIKPSQGLKLNFLTKLNAKKKISFNCKFDLISVRQAKTEAKHSKGLNKKKIFLNNLFFDLNYVIRRKVIIMSYLKKKHFLQNKKRNQDICFYFYHRKTKTSAFNSTNFLPLAPLAAGKVRPNTSKLGPAEPLTWPCLVLGPVGHGKVGPGKTLVFRQSFYIVKHNYVNRKGFDNLYRFFAFANSFISKITICSFSSACLTKPTSLAKKKQELQKLHLQKKCIVYSLPLLQNFFSRCFLGIVKCIINKSLHKNSFFRKRNKTPFLEIIFSIAIKYFKKIKISKKSCYNQSFLNLSTIIHVIKFNQFILNKLRSVKPFYKKVVVIRKIQSPYFFLTRPLFSLTRFDTFNICKSLKLPIYPDKSNLRVDFFTK